MIAVTAIAIVAVTVLAIVAMILDYLEVNNGRNI